MKKILLSILILASFTFQSPNVFAEEEHHETESEISSSFLNKINDLFDENNFLSILYILGIIFLLGLFHPLQPGHGKSILFSYLIEKKRSTKDELIFISTMTFSHIFDLIILAIILKIFLFNLDSHEILHWLQKGAAIILLIMSAYYIGKLFIKKKEEEDHCHKCKCESHSKTKGPILAFIAGITPCAIGWSIMIILFNLNQNIWIIPSIAIFAIGIWLSLFILSKIITKSRDFFENKIQNISKITSIISPIILLIVAILLLFS